MDSFYLLDGAQHPSAACSHAAGGVSYILRSLSLSFACSKSSLVTGWWYRLNVLPGICISRRSSIAAWESSVFLRSFAKVFGSTVKEGSPPPGKLAWGLPVVSLLGCSRALGASKFSSSSGWDVGELLITFIFSG